MKSISLTFNSIEFHGYLCNWPTIYESASLLDVLCKPIIGRFHYNNNTLCGIFSQLLLFNLAMRIHSWWKKNIHNFIDLEIMNSICVVCTPLGGVFPTCMVWWVGMGYILNDVWWYLQGQFIFSKLRYISIISLLHAFNCKLKIYDNADKITTHTPSNKSKWLKQTFCRLRFGLALADKDEWLTGGSGIYR